jgi:hypothetical protein
MSQENQTEEGVDPFSSEKVFNIECENFGSFSATPPNDPHVKNVSYQPDGSAFASTFEDREEHLNHAKGHHSVIRLQKAVEESNFVNLSASDTPCLQGILTFVKPFIRGNPDIKTCWRHLAKKCPDIDPFEEF